MEATVILFEQRVEQTKDREIVQVKDGILFDQVEGNLEPDSLDPQKLEEKDMDMKDPSFKKKLKELDKKLKEIEDPDEAWLLIETSFLRDYDDFEVETKIYQMEIAHGTKILVNQ